MCFSVPHGPANVAKDYFEKLEVMSQKEGGKAWASWQQGRQSGEYCPGEFS